MANYSLSINSTFQPFTYQELVAPVIHQQQVMDNLIEQYEKLSSQADVLEAMGANDRDKKSGSYSRYKAYSDSLRNEVDYLYQNGLDTTSRERLTDLRRRYNTEIVPIQNAWTKREQEVKDQMTASMANPSLMFTRNAKDTSLDQYLADPVGGYGVINGANITAQMSAMTKNLANKYRSGELERVDPATYNYIKKFGLDENMIRDWESYPTLKKMYEQVMQANGVTPEALKNSPNASSIIDKAHSYAEMGMWNAMGKDETQIVENFDYRLAQQTKAEIEKANAKGGGDDGMEVIPSVAIGLEPTEEFKAKHLEALMSLKHEGSYDGLKASIFGNHMGDVNPMQIYDEYQKAVNKYGGKNRISATSMAVGHYNGGEDARAEIKYGPTPAENLARKEILKKYKKYGVTDILSDAQYNALKAIGYSETTRFSNNRHSTFLNDLNRTVEQKSSYSTHMPNYDNVSETLLSNLRSGRHPMWKIDSETGKEGNSTSGDDTAKVVGKLVDKDKRHISDIQYDPAYKGKLRLQFNSGEQYNVNASALDGTLANYIEYWESKGFSAQAITAGIKDYFNSYNPNQSNTDSHARTY